MTATATTRNRKMKLAAVTAASVVVLLGLMLPPLVLATSTDAVGLVLLALAEYALAGYAVAHIGGGRVRSTLRGPTGYVCRHCGTDMTVSLCTRGHTHEAGVYGSGGSA